MTSSTHSKYTIDFTSSDDDDEIKSASSSSLENFEELRKVSNDFLSKINEFKNKSKEFSASKLKDPHGYKSIEFKSFTKRPKKCNDSDSNSDTSSSSNIDSDSKSDSDSESDTQSESSSVKIIQDKRNLSDNKSKKIVKSVSPNIKKNKQATHEEIICIADDTDEDAGVEAISPPSSSKIKEASKHESKEEENDSNLNDTPIEDGPSKTRRQYNYEAVPENSKIEKEIEKICNLNMLENYHIEYMVLRDVNYFIDIFSGNCEHSWRHKEYKKFSKKSGNFLYENSALTCFTLEQYTTACQALQFIFCKKNHKYDEYIIKVLLPEALIKICMRIYQCSKPSAEEFLLKNNVKKLNKNYPKNAMVRPKKQKETVPPLTIVDENMTVRARKRVNNSNSGSACL